MTTASIAAGLAFGVATAAATVPAASTVIGYAPPPKRPQLQQWNLAHPTPHTANWQDCHDFVLGVLDDHGGYTFGEMVGAANEMCGATEDDYHGVKP